MNLEHSAKEKIDIISSILRKEGLNPSPVIRKEYNYETIVMQGNESVKVLVYFGRKGVKTVLQGNTEAEFYGTIKNLIVEELELSFQKENLREPDEYIGTDESGKGDFFGPLVTASVFIDAESRIKLIRAGIRDSKELNGSQIHTAARKIKTICKNNFDIILISPEKYNRLYEKFGNLNSLLNWAHSRAIENLIESVKCNTVITDKFGSRELNISQKRGLGHIDFIQTPKAERYTAVAAASILARDAFNKWFKTQAAKGLNLPKGASIEVEEAAAKLVKEKGESILNKLAKLHFKTAKKLRSR